MSWTNLNPWPCTYSSNSLRPSQSNSTVGENWIGDSLRESEHINNCPVHDAKQLHRRCKLAIKVLSHYPSHLIPCHLNWSWLYWAHGPVQSSSDKIRWDEMRWDEMRWVIWTLLKMFYLLGKTPFLKFRNFYERFLFFFFQISELTFCHYVCIMSQAHAKTTTIDS